MNRKSLKKCLGPRRFSSPLIFRICFEKTASGRTDFGTKLAPEMKITVSTGSFRSWKYILIKSDEVRVKILEEENFKRVKFSEVSP